MGRAARRRHPRHHRGPRRGLLGARNLRPHASRSWTSRLASRSSCASRARRSTRYTYSSHEDVFATVFDFMGLEGPSGPILAGKSLLRYDAGPGPLRARVRAHRRRSVDDRLGVAGDGLKIVFVNRPPFETVSTFRRRRRPDRDSASAGHRGPGGRPEAPRRRRADHPLRTANGLSRSRPGSP